MSTFALHTVASAPEASKPKLEASKKAFGMLPNLHAVMAESPELLEAYKTLGNLFGATSFDNTERTVIWQAINVEHGCHYCVPAHTAIAKMQGVDEAVTQALRNEEPIADARLETLRTFTLQVVRQRGEVEEAQVAAFLEAGFTRTQVLELLVGVAQKVLSNYVNHLAQTPVDPPFQPFAWSKK